MKLAKKDKNYEFKKTDTAAIFLSEEYLNETDIQIPPNLSFLKEKIDLSYIKGKATDILFVPMKEIPNIIIIGIGKKDEIDIEHLRNSSSKISTVCKNRKISEINIILPELNNISELDILTAIAEGVYLSNYEFNKYKTNDTDNNISIKKAHFLTGTKGAGRQLNNIKTICENTILCRDLVNESSEKANPLAIANKAKSMSKLENVTCTVFSKNELQKMKMGLLLAVGRGSRISPQFVVLKYKGNPNSKKHIAFIGKGITFDSGGMNLKSSGHIETMRQDMAGAAASLYALKTCAELKLKKNIYTVIPLCENMLNNDSYRPGDIFTSYSGKSVEIGNTDAEGRLILADALAYTEEKLKPDYIVNIATLTGACLISFGEILAAVLSTNEELAEHIFQAGETSGDRVWRLPLYKEYDEAMKSNIADIKNSSGSRHAGTIMGGIFLKSFVKDTPWAHIDIAGTAWYSKKRGYRPKMATGFGVRLFVELVKSLNI